MAIPKFYSVRTVQRPAGVKRSRTSYKTPRHVIVEVRETMPDIEQSGSPMRTKRLPNPL
jgi:hypothetical protein